METRSFENRCFEAIVYTLLTVVAVLVLYPLVFVLSASVSDPAAVLNGEMWLWPKDLSFVGYKKVLENHDLLRSYTNTIVYTVIGTAINLVMTVMAAYPLSQKSFYGRNVITAFMVFTMFFSGGLVPAYMLVKQLGMLNSMWALLIPGSVSVWNIVIMRTFFQNSIPSEMQEAAAIDGCSDWKALWRIVLPLSMPILAVMVLFYAVGHWNAYFSALIYLTDRELYPLQLLLREFLVQGEMEHMVNVGDSSHAKTIMDQEAVKYAVVVVANLPILLLYPFLQQYFVKGIMIGALKG
ncbi:L-arabinose transport system permease protein AraQ [Paenibacillus konkukensis]|uniref:L-arabinose transport system permease protein AraQ n=1 Tax=Paenibacillus konkukensis TaxID=2020716 RepID=A0ABY4RP24_9BACL|nr:carbohydrate ABC transporter permease [Paenibacillus konkukensis]UQZ84216.1 L-arabinose transport system permease protein AraQ [Paenibacillus konkukensis]